MTRTAPNRLAASMLVVWTLGFVGYSGADTPKPPVAKVVPHTTEIHGQTRVDDYYWLRERSNPEVIAYLEAENTYTAALMKHTEALQQRLFEELKGRIKQTDESVPYRDGEYFYYTRTVEGQQYRIHCRKRGSLAAEEEVLLDENALATGHEYFAVGVFAVSPDQRWLAYSVDVSGSEQYVLRFKDLETGALAAESIPNTYYGVAWANDNRTVFYVVLDDAKRPYKLLRHHLGTDPREDAPVYHEADARFFVSPVRARSDEYLFISVGSETTSEWYYLDADEPNGAFRVVAARRQGVEYDVAHQGDRFLIVTNDQAVNFRLMEAPVGAPTAGNWREVIPHRPEVKLDAVDAFADYVVVYERRAGLRTIQVRDARTDGAHQIELPESVYATYPETNAEYQTNTLRFVYTSLVTPRSVYDYDMKTRTRALRKRDEVLGGYEPANYETQRVYATATDGTRIPISLVQRRGLPREGGNPTLLYGYGSYGGSMDPGFRPNVISLLDRGMIFAIAHVRGGGELGRPWYDAGKLLHTRNRFTDFIACAEYLIAEGYTCPKKLAAMGGSAGGLLMGAVATMCPDLFDAVVAEVPFVDVVNTMLDASVPLTVIEYEEWGNPSDKQHYEYILSYSPYDNVKAQSYPHLLITAGLNDPRVQYWEPAKWTAKLRAHKTGDNWLLLKTNMGAGHGGASGRYDALKEDAFDYAFILDRLGVE